MVTYVLFTVLPVFCYFLLAPIQMLVGTMLVLVDVQYYTQHSSVASIQILLQGGLQGRGFSAIKEYRLHACLEDPSPPYSKVLEAADLYHCLLLS